MKKKNYITLGLTMSLACLQFTTPVCALGASPQDVGINQSQPSGVDQVYKPVITNPVTTVPGVFSPSEASVASTTTTPSAITDPPKSEVPAPVELPKIIDLTKPVIPVDAPVAASTSQSVPSTIQIPQSEIKYKVSGFSGIILGNLTIDIMLGNEKVATVSLAGVTDVKEIISADKLNLKPKLHGKGKLNGFKLQFQEILPALPPIIVPPVVVPVVTKPVATDPVVADPVVTKPVATDLVVDDPVVIKPIVTDPVVTDPSVTKPIATKPIVVDTVVPIVSVDPNKTVAPIDSVVSVNSVDKSTEIQTPPVGVTGPVNSIAQAGSTTQPTTVDPNKTVAPIDSAVSVNSVDKSTEIQTPPVGVAGPVNLIAPVDATKQPTATDPEKPVTITPSTTGDTSVDPQTPAVNPTTAYTPTISEATTEATPSVAK